MLVAKSPKKASQVSTAESEIEIFVYDSLVRVIALLRSLGWDLHPLYYSSIQRIWFLPLWLDLICYIPALPRFSSTESWTGPGHKTITSLTSDIIVLYQLAQARNVLHFLVYPYSAYGLYPY